jgi:outer membrane receptor for ferrienterochelin and colicins
VTKLIFTFILLLSLFRPIGAQICLRSGVDSSAVANALVRQGEMGTAYFSDSKGNVRIPDLQNGFIYVTIIHPEFDTLTSFIKIHQIIYLTPRLSKFNQVIYTGSLSDKKANKDLIGQARVINSAEIRNTGSQNLGDILKYQPNITLTNDAVLGTSVSVNGMSGQNVKLLKNGAAISGTMNGSVDVSQINVNNIEQIEIIEGPMSLLYGSNALAGTINLISKVPVKKSQFTAKTHTESSGVYNVSAGVSKTIRKKYLNLYLGRNFFDGWNPGNRLFYNPVSKEANEQRNTLWKPREQVLGDLSLLIPFHKSSDLKVNADYLNETILNRGLPMQPYFESAFDDYYKTLRNINSVELNLRYNKIKHNVLLSYTYYKRIKNTYLKDLTQAGEGILSAPEGQDTTQINTSQARYIASAKVRQLALNLGIDANHERFKGKRVLENRQSISNISFVGIVSYKFKNKHDIRFGIRQTLHSLNKIPLIPSFSSRISLSKTLDLKLSIAKGYRTPGVKELYLYFVDINHNIKGNEQLKSESSMNYNAVLSYQKKLSKNSQLSAQLNAYYNTFKNLITLAAITTTEYTYINIGESKSKGLNMDLKFENRRMEVSFQNAVIASSNNNTDYPVPTFFTTINNFMRGSYKFLKNRNLVINAFVNHFGKSPSMAYVNSLPVVIHTQDYWMIDLTANYHFMFRNNHINMTGGLKNLNNITNLRSGVNNASAHQVATGQRIISTGRTIFLSLEYTL